MEHLTHRAENIHLHLARVGTGSPMLLLHGAGEQLSGDVFRKNVDRLAEQHTVYALDWPNRGWSSSSDITIAAYPQLARSIMDAYQPEQQWTIMGQSMGAGVTLHIARQFMERLERIIVIAPPPVARLGAGLESITIPTNIIWGSEDDVVPVVHAAALHAIIPNSTLDIIPDAKHWPHFETPEALHAILEKYGII